MNNPVATYISKQARAVLLFPNIVKTGFGFGCSYGKGILTKGAAVAGYYKRAGRGYLDRDFSKVSGISAVKLPAVAAAL